MAKKTTAALAKLFVSTPPLSVNNDRRSETRDNFTQMPGYFG